MLSFNHESIHSDKNVLSKIYLYRYKFGYLINTMFCYFTVIKP